MLPKFVQELFTSRKNYGDGDTRVGQTGRLWYESETNSIRVSDGIRAGGRIVAGGVYYDSATTSLKWYDVDADIEYIISSSAPIAPNKLVNGSFELTLNNDGTVSFVNYTFPLEDGTDGQVLTTDGTGNVYWQSNSITTVSDTAPRKAFEGDLWYNTLVNSTFVYVNGDWVASATGGGSVNKIIDIGDVYTGGPGDPMLVDGVTLIYAATEERWETKPIDSQAINLDGGNY
jgi:hypothetical protein